MDGVKSVDTPRIDLSSVSEVRLPSGHVYILYYDIKEQKPVMLRNNNTSKSAKEQIETLQNNSQNYQSDDALYNTNGLLEMEKQYTREEVILVPVDQIDKYQYLLSTKSAEESKTISILIKNKDRFNPKLKYINFEECLAIDENNNVIVCYYNNITNQYDVRYADMVKYEKNEDEKAASTNIDDIDYDNIINTIEISNQPVEVAGCMIDLNTLEQYNNYPEVFEKTQMQPEQRTLWQRLLEAYRRRKQLQNGSTKPNMKTLSPNYKKAGFTNQFLAVSLAGFTIGIMVAVLFIVIKKFYGFF